MHLASHAGPWGIRAGTVSFDFKKVMARKNALIKDFADYRRQQLAGGKFEFIRANARFLDAYTVELTSQPLTPSHSPQGGEWLSAGRVRGILSPREISSSQPDRALRRRPCPTPRNQLPHSDEALTLKRLPKSLIVLGGGAIACEFAQFFTRFGVKVTLIQRSEHILREFDTDAALEIEKVFRREGMGIFTKHKLTDAKRDGHLKTVSFQHEGKTISVSAGEILFALGRVPNTASLNLAGAGVASERGRIVANEFMQTSAPHIYAAGDCTGPHEIVHLACSKARLRRTTLRGHVTGAKMDYRLLISVVFTEPKRPSWIDGKGSAGARPPVFGRSYPFNTTANRSSWRPGTVS